MAQTITVTLQAKQLIYDIQNKTYLLGTSRRAEGTANYEATSHMMASDDEENNAEIRRAISTAFARAKVELAEYLSGTATTSDNALPSLGNSDSLSLQFSVPSNFNNAAVDSIAANLHDFIVCRACFEWFMLTNKADAADYATRADVSMAAAKKALYERKRPTIPS